jgi:enoyl-[acyl-carrier-protein] reductase (NADH)
MSLIGQGVTLRCASTVGAYPAFLASPEAANITGGIHYIDGGYHIRGLNHDVG